MHTDPRRHGSETLDRSKRLEQDFRELKILSREKAAFEVIDFDASLNSYQVKFDITSVVQLYNKKLSKWKGFFFEIQLHEKYPKKPPRCSTCRSSMIPFHPHISKFELSNGFVSKAEWVDFRKHDPDEGLGSLLQRIAYSLQYFPEYVDINAPKIGNQEALEWYVNYSAVYGDNIWGDLLGPEGKLPSTPEKSSPKKFEISDTTKPFQPLGKELPKFNIASSSNFYLHQHEESHRLYITSNAMEQIKQHIKWGANSRTNRNEQGGLLLGLAYTDIKRDLIYAIVDQAIPGRSAKGSRAYLKMDHRTWKEMIDCVDKISESESTHQSQIIGWYHTHPSELSVFMSGTDRETQRLTFSENWQFAVVLNPQKKIWRAFYGADSIECKGFLI